MDKLTKKATEQFDLEQNIMDPTICKNESMWWARSEIIELRTTVAEQQKRIAEAEKLIEQLADCLRTWARLYPDDVYPMDATALAAAKQWKGEV